MLYIEDISLDQTVKNPSFAISGRLTDFDLQQFTGEPKHCFGWNASGTLTPLGKEL